MATEDMEVDGDFVERLTVVKAVIANFAQARVGDSVWCYSAPMPIYRLR